MCETLNRQARCGKEQTLTGFRVGVMDLIIAARPAADTFTRANYFGALANRVDSFWVPDHLNGLLPQSLWMQKYSGATKLIPTLDAYMEPWTMLGHIAAGRHHRASGVDRNTQPVSLRPAPSHQGPPESIGCSPKVTQAHIFPHHGGAAPLDN